MITLRTADTPVATTRGKFPYDEVIRTLKLLDSTKAIIFEEQECTYYNILRLRKIAENFGLNDIRKAQVKDKVYIWANK